MVQYKKFQLDSLFDIRYGKFIPKRKAGTKVPFVTTRSGNNGIAYYVDSKPMCKGDALTIASDGSVGETYYQDKPFSASNIAVIMEPHEDVRKAWTPQSALYLSALIKQYARAKYDWGRKYSVNRVRATQLELPVTSAGQPDFAYMTARIRELEAERIRELEAERIRELEAYLSVTGLDDTTLSASEAQALTQKVKWKKFRIGDVFDIHPSARKINANAVKFNGHYPYVARGTSTNGIRGYINWDTNDLNPANTISFGQDTATIYYQDKPYFTGDKIQIFELKDRFPKLNSETAQFMIACMNAVFGNYTWGQQSFAVKKLREAKFMLPVTFDNDIDFDYMQNYIRATEKQTIKGVVEYKDRVIAETKKVVGE